MPRKEMGLVDIILTGILLVAVGGTLYYVYTEIYQPHSAFTQFVANTTQGLPEKSVQFYPRMRFPDKKIAYRIEPSCTLDKQRKIAEAFSVLSEKTILEFVETAREEGIVVLCSNVALTPEQEGHFVAGEGGPTLIINTTRFYIILGAQVALYRPEKCDRPNIALHEIFHALGFDHNTNKQSIMYPVADCSQEIDQYLISTIDELYRVPSAPDLAIAQVSVNKTGRLLDFNISIDNYGLTASENSTLEVYASNELVDSFVLNELGLGKRKLFSVSNLRVPGDATRFTFKVVQTAPGSELSLENNEVTAQL